MPLATTVCTAKAGPTPRAHCLSGYRAPRCAVRSQFTHSAQRRLTLCQYLLFAACTLLLQAPALGIGTVAGTDIYNTATANYVIAGNSASTSSTVSFRVDEKLDVNVSWQDAANISVTTPDTDRVTTWLLTNTGNGNNSYTLTVNNAIGGDQFDPAFVDIYLDANSNGAFEVALDTLYAPGVNDPLLAPDATQLVFIRNSVPGGLNNNDLGNTELLATSVTGSGLPGTSIANAGDNGTTAVIGTTGGSSFDTGTYEIINTTVVLAKSVVITDPLGGNQPVTGAILAYSIDATVTGPGTASAVIISDILPANTSYTGGSLRLNIALLTDAADGDAGDVDDTSSNTVTVNLGDLTAVSTVQTISFEVTIN